MIDRQPPRARGVICPRPGEPDPYRLNVPRQRDEMDEDEDLGAPPHHRRAPRPEPQNGSDGR